LILYLPYPFAARILGPAAFGTGSKDDCLPLKKMVRLNPFSPAAFAGYSYI
jgi:hypothetical protein